MIRLHQFAPVWNLPNASTFCMKVETYLRMTRLPYESVITSNPGRGPKGKLPFIEDQGRVIGDSRLIIDHLKQRYGDPLDGALSAPERAQALALTRLIEEHAYWALVYSRWIDPANWPQTRAAFFGTLPEPARAALGGLVRRNQRKLLHGHGLGRLSPGEIDQLARADVDAIADFLGDKPYAQGDTPTSLDATLYAYLANLLWTPTASAAKRRAQERPQLDAYCQRMRERFYA